MLLNLLIDFFFLILLTDRTVIDTPPWADHAADGLVNGLVDDMDGCLTG